MILYLHGFNSAPSSHKARTMQRYMAARGMDGLFRCPALPHDPREAVPLIAAELDRAPGATLVGSSLGGFYATWFAEQRGLRAVLVQPSVYGTDNTVLLEAQGEGRSVDYFLTDLRARMSGLIHREHISAIPPSPQEQSFEIRRS